MANALVERIGKPARLASLRHESWIDGDADDVATGRYGVLPVPAVKNKELTPELPNIGVRPTLTYALIASDVRGSATQKLSVVVIWAGVSAVLLNIDHAESALSCTPYVAGRRIDQFIKRVVTEVEMVVTGRKFVQSVIRGDVVVWIAKRKIAVPYVWSRYCEAQQ